MLPLLLSLAVAAGGANVRTATRFGASSNVVAGQWTFSTCGCQASGTNGLTVVRNATESYVCADGVLRSCAANQLAVTESGMQSYGAFREILLRTNSFATTWTAQNVGAPVQNATGPDGQSNSAWTVTATASTGEHRLYQSWTNTDGQTHTHSVYAKAGTVSWIGLTDGGGAYSGQVNLATCAATGNVTSQALGSTGWCRFWLVHAITGPGNYTTINLGDTQTHAVAGTSWTAAGTETVLLYGANAHLGSAPYPYVAAAGTVVDQPATVVSASNPLTTSDFCLTVEGAPGDKWDRAGASWALGSLGAYSAASRAFLYLNAGSIYGAIQDASNGNRVAAKSGLTGSTAAAYSVCSTSAGAITIGKSGVDQGATLSGAGTGIIGAQPATIYIGGMDATNSFPLNGFVSRVKVCKVGTPARCP
jgi:hypothetical protein